MTPANPAALTTFTRVLNALQAFSRTVDTAR